MRKIVSLIFFVFIAACSPLNHEGGGTASKVDAYGNTVFLDTKENRLLMTLGYDGGIQSEKNGERVQAADASWQDHWLGIIDSLNKKGENGAYLTENHQFYIDYIINKRRAAGLPDLPVR